MEVDYPLSPLLETLSMNQTFLNDQRAATGQAAEIVLDQTRAIVDLALDTVSKAAASAIEQGNALAQATTPEAGQAIFANGLKLAQDQVAGFFQAGQVLFASNLKAAETLGQITKARFEAAAGAFAPQAAAKSSRAR